MALYTSVTGWVAYYDDLDVSVSTAAIRQAIEAAAARAPERVRESDREFMVDYAADVAAGWHFLKGSGGHGADIAFWSGVIRESDTFLIRDQIEAIAAVLPPEYDLNRTDGVIGYAIQGVFDVVFESDDTPPVEWRLYAGAVHETRRAVPPSDVRRI